MSWWLSKEVILIRLREKSMLHCRLVHFHCSFLIHRHFQFHFLVVILHLLFYLLSFFKISYHHI